MTLEEIEAERVSALTERDRLQAELGQVLMNGGDKARGASLTKSLQKAQAKLEEIERAAAAISKATEAAAKAAAEREEREAQEALERRLRAAHDDLDDIRASAAGVDRALDDLAQAMDEHGGRMRDYVAKHSALGLHHNVVSVFTRPDWCEAVLVLLKSKGARDMRRHMAVRNLSVYGKAGRPIADIVPDISTILTGKGPRKGSTGPRPA